MAAALVLMLITSALTLATPYLVKIAIDQHIARGDAMGLARIALLMAGAFLGIYLASSGQQYLLSWVGQRVLATLRAQLFRHLQGERLEMAKELSAQSRQHPLPHPGEQVLLP